MRALPAWTAGVRREVLPNGLTLLVQRDTSAPVAAVVTHVKAGFFDEPDRWTGISHVLEHMFFKGTPTRGVGRIARDTKAAGGYLNASTTYDHTTYFVVLPCERLAEAVAIQSDALQHALIDTGELARELQVIIQEARRKLDTPSAVTHERLHELMYDRHRIRRWRIGLEADLARLTREDLWGYYTSRYRPDRTIVAIVGDVSEEQALALGRQAYAGWSVEPQPIEPSPAEPPRREVRARTLRGDVTTGEVALGWRGVPPLHPDAIPLDVAAAVLGTGRGCWLYRALRETGIALSVFASHYSPTELGVFSIGAEFPPDRLDQVLDQVAGATARLALAGPGPEDLERAKTLLLTRWSRRMEETDGRAVALAAAEALDSFSLVDRDFEMLAAVTAEDVRRVAAGYLDPEAVSGVCYLPHQQGTDLTTDRLARTFAVSQVSPAGAPPAVGPPVPAAVRVQGRDEAGVRHVRLPAVDLLLRPKRGVPTVTLGLYLPRTEFDPTGKEGVSALTLRSATRGAGGLKAADLAFLFERAGGTLASSVGLDWVGVSSTVLAPHLAEAASLLDLVLFQPTLARDQVEAERRLLVNETRQVADDMFRYPFQLALAAGFGDAGYGVPANGRPETVADLTAADLARWHELAFLGRRAVFVAVGAFEADRAADVLAGVFGRHPARQASALDRPEPFRLEAGVSQRVVRRDKAQSAFAMAFPGPSRRDPRRHASEVWSAVASGLGGRLFEALRERRSLAYTVMASAWPKARAGGFLTYIATAPEREEEARQAMLHELARFREEPVSPVELRQATEYLAGQVAVGRQSSSALAGEILEAWLAGEGLGELADPASRYRAVTAADVQLVASQILGTGDGPAMTRAEGVVRGANGGAGR